VCLAFQFFSFLHVPVPLLKSIPGRLENYQEFLKVAEKVQEMLAIGPGRFRGYRENLTKFVPGSGTDKNPLI
jgi:hypothetical protein